LWTARYTFRTADERFRATLEAMTALALDGSRNPSVRNAAIRSLRGIGPDTASQARRLTRFVQALEFRRDPIGAELVQEPLVTLQDVRAGDCDDLSTLLAALLLSVGIPASFILSRDDRAHPREFSHVLVSAHTEDGVLFLDPSRRDGQLGPVSLTGATTIPIGGAPNMIGQTTVPSDQLSRATAGTTYIVFLKSALSLPYLTPTQKASIQAELQNVMDWIAGKTNQPPNVGVITQYIQAGRAGELTAKLQNILPRSDGSIPILPAVQVSAMGKFPMWGWFAIFAGGAFLLMRGRRR
jgi:hypothetical protein